MFKHSITISLILRLFAMLKKGFDESLFINSIYGVIAYLSEKGKESFIHNWFTSDTFTDKYYKSSFFYRVLNSVFQFLLGLVKKILLWIEKLGNYSITVALVKKVLSLKYMSIDCVLAVFIGIMFAAPHELWNNLYAFLAACFFAAWVFVYMALGKIKAKTIYPVGICIVGFLVTICLSTVTALVISDAVRIALFLIASVFLAYSVYASVDTKEKLIRFLKIVLVSVTFTAVIGFVQRIMGIEVDPEFVDMATNAGMPGRVFSTFSNPNNFAELLLLFMPFFVPVFLAAKKKSEKLMVLGAFVIVLGALLMTYSRSCWVGFAIAAIAFVIMYDVRLLVPMAIVVLVAIPLLPETIMNRIFTIGSLKDSSNSYRLYIWDSCLRMIRDFGVTGLGLGPSSFRTVYPSYADPVAITAPHSHMLYMEIILEMGVLGFVTFFGYMYSVIKKTFSKMHQMDNVLKSVAIAGLSALMGIAFVCCAEYVWFYPRVMFAFWIVPGILLSVARISKNEQ